MSIKYLVDANLPYYFSIWKTNEYIHVFDLNDSWSDKEIWNYAKVHNLTIISKDADFSNLILLNQPPPKVIHIRLGNMTVKALFQLLSNNWKSVTDLSEKHKLVNLFQNRIEVIS